MMSFDNTSADDTRPFRDEPTSDLIRGIGEDVVAFVEQEVKSMRAEVSQAVSGLRTRLLALMIGAACAGIGMVLIAFAVGHALLALGLPLWASYLIVGGGLAVIGLIGVGIGVTMRPADLVPQQTLRQFKEDLQWTKQYAQLTSP